MDKAAIWLLLTALGTLVLTVIAFAGNQYLKPAKNGELRWGIWIALFGASLVSLAASFAALFFDPANTGREYALLMAIIFGALGAAYLAEYSMMHGKFDADGISLRTPWSSSKKELWSNLISARYSHFKSCHELEFENGMSISISDYVKGKEELLKVIAELDGKKHRSEDY